MSSAIKYRAEIDGLRAVAVIAVVLYHAGIALKGGFIGVDVFFVISGYLITSIILKEVRAGEFTLKKFWERRARRILPASSVLLICVAIASLYLLMPRDMIHIGRTLIAQAFFSSNVYFNLTTNYFSESAEGNPLLHMWSLGVEEQFYFIFPFIILVLKGSVISGSRLTVIFLIFIWLLSFILSDLLLETNPSFAFFQLATRAWELLTGAIVALLPATQSRVFANKYARETISIIAILLIVLPMFVYDSSTLFPGKSALPPVMGTGLLIWINNPSFVDTPTCVARFLSLRYVVFIGLISYSWYLWHWPFYAFSNYWNFGHIDLGTRLIYLALGFICSLLSYYLVETPFRKRVVATTRSSIFKVSFMLLFGTFSIGFCVVMLKGIPSRFDEQTLRIDGVRYEARGGGDIAEKISFEQALRGEFPSVGDLGTGEVDVFVWGDSHARSIIPAFDYLSNLTGECVMYAWSSSTPPLLNYWVDKPFSLKNKSIEYNDLIFKKINELGIKKVVLASRWSTAFEEGQEQEFQAALLNTIEKLSEIGVKAYLFLEVPNYDVSVPRMLSARHVLGREIDPVSYYSGESYGNKLILALNGDLNEFDCVILDPRVIMDDGNGRFTISNENGLPLYSDGHHLSKEGALYLLEILLVLYQ